MNNVSIALAFLVFGWGFGLEAEYERVQLFFEQQQIGSSQDFFLVKKNAFGMYEKVAVVFGYVDDATTCTDFAAAYMRKYPGDTYVCWPAN